MVHSRRRYSAWGMGVCGEMWLCGVQNIQCGSVGVDVMWVGGLGVIVGVGIGVECEVGAGENGVCSVE